MVKNSIIVIVVAAIIYVWWTYPLAALRGGEELDQKIENIENQIEETESIIQKQNQLTAEFESREGLSAAAVDRKIEEYKSSFSWFGDPNQENELERYTGPVCNHIRNHLSSSLNDESDHITTFNCTIGQSQPFQPNIDTLPISLDIGTACEGDAERLVLAVDKNPTMLILQMSASNTEEDADGGTKVTRENVNLNIDFYVLNTPPEDRLEAAEKEVRKESLEFDIGQTRQELLEAAHRAKQGEEGSPPDTDPPAFACPTD